MACHERAQWLFVLDPSPSRRLRACEHVQWIPLLFAVPLDPSPPPAACSPTNAHGSIVADNALMALGFFLCFPSSPPALCTTVACPHPLVVIPRPPVIVVVARVWPDASGGTRATATHPWPLLLAPPINGYPRGRPSTPATSPSSTSSSQPLARALGALLPAIAATAVASALTTFGRARAPLLL